MTHFLKAALSVLIPFLFLASNSLAENWPQWRGPSGDGVSSERGLPIVWSETRGIVWKCDLPAWGNSTPAIWGDAIFVTSHAGDDLLLLRINKADGEIVWTRTVGTGRAPREAPRRERQKFHLLHNLATPSPVTDGEVVVVHFGNGDLAAYDFDGEQLWKRNLQEDYGDYTIWWGHANSPVIHDGTVISVCMQDSLADLRDEPVRSYVVAHDLRDGHVKWEVDRNTGAQAEEGDSYTTPLLREIDGRLQLIVMGGNQLDAYNPDTGHQIWFLSGLRGGRTVTGPVVGEELIFATRGMREPLVAMRPGIGELPRNNIAWQYEPGTPDSSSPVLWNELLFFVADNGIARCIDIRAGNRQWVERLEGQYKASPIVSEGRIYFLNTTGLCTVVSATRRYNRLTQNQIEGETIASPAVSEGRLYIRSRDALYCIGR